MPQLAHYLDIKLAALGQPTAGAASTLLETVGPLLRSHRQKDQLIGQYLCPADLRIQAFLDAYTHAAPPLPADTFILDRPGLARLMSLPPERAHVFVPLSALLSRAAGRPPQPRE